MCAAALQSGTKELSSMCAVVYAPCVPFFLKRAPYFSLQHVLWRRFVKRLRGHCPLIPGLRAEPLLVPLCKAAKRLSGKKKIEMVFLSLL
jgi:hypothetical protein